MYQRVVINTLSFNDNIHYTIKNARGLGKPPTRQVDYDVAGENFGLFVNALYGGRTFSLEGTVIGDSFADFVTRRDALYEACDILNGEFPLLFTLGNGRVVQINATCLDLDIPGEAGVVVASDFQAQFKASFPYLLSPTTMPYTVALPVGGGGSIPPATMPMGLSGSIGGSISVVNKGNAPYWPLVRIYGPVTNPQLTHVQSGLALLVNITLAAGQYIDIDFKRKTIYDNLGASQYAGKAGDWWKLLPGAQTIAFSASSYSSSALATIFAQDSWLGI